MTSAASTFTGLNPLEGCGIISAFSGGVLSALERKTAMEEAKKKLRVYCETSFWSYLTGRPSAVQKTAYWQSLTRIWWSDEAVNCDIYISQHVLNEAAKGDPELARQRIEACKGMNMVDGTTPEVDALAGLLLATLTVPEDEVADAYHIATAAVHGMDVLLTWNCKHMANRFALPKTISVVSSAGYECPAIVTPEDFLKEELE